MPTYDATKPDVDESPFVAPGQLQDNFSIIKTTVEQDHQWDDTPVADSGKHDKSTYTEQGTDPTTLVNEVATYSKEAQSVAQLFMRRESDGADVQLTSSDVTDATAQTTNGYSCLPGGVLIQWGTVATPAKTGSVVFPKSFTTDPPYSITLQLQRSSDAQTSNVDSTVPPTITGFGWRISSAGSANLYWMAIGKA